MTRHLPLVGLLFCAVSLGIACEKHESNPVTPPARRSTEVGTIRGQAIFVGKAPTPRAIDNHACHPGAKPIVDESVLVSASGGLKNVVVYLKDADAAPPPATQPTIDQVDCQYMPHVLAIQAGQRVVFKSSEPASVAHNIHIASLGINQSITGSGTLPPVKFEKADFVNVRCDVHPWMSCWVAVIDHPCFAVTDAQGNFEIKNVPAGTYTLTAWHERLPVMEQEIVVKANETAEVSLKYQAP